MELGSFAALGGGRHFRVVWGRTGSHMLGISSRGCITQAKKWIEGNVRKAAEKGGRGPGKGQRRNLPG